MKATRSLLITIQWSHFVSVSLCIRQKPASMWHCSDDLYSQIRFISLTYCLDEEVTVFQKVIPRFYFAVPSINVQICSIDVSSIVLFC